ncbi:MAG: hypothetical protein RBR05_03490, partial [Candidatus Methanomethylophilaceae archaeon]|nr:hypothetical protein [Candidatus Methanomethylophilaceae archaeon]
TIDATSGAAISIEKISEGTASSVTISLIGVNTLTGAANYAALYVEEGSTVIIEDCSEDISIGSLTATGGDKAAGIGGNSCTGQTDSGSIIIKSGIVNAISVAASSMGGAAIGGAYNGNGYVTINGGTVIAKATAFLYAGAAIGSGAFDTIQTLDYSSDLNVDFVDDEGNSYTGFNGIVTITGGFVTVSDSSIGGAHHSNSLVTITGGNITVNSGSIGNTYGTSGGSSADPVHFVLSVIIIDSSTGATDVNVTSGYYWTSPIGGGMGTDAYISISGDDTTVIANSVNTIDTSEGNNYKGVPGIGSGYYGIVRVTISDGATVYAQGGNSAPGIGNAVTRLAKDGLHVLPAMLGSILYSYVHIGGGANVTAYGGIYAPGIGAGRGNSQMDVQISGDDTIVRSFAGGYLTGDEECGAAAIGLAYLGITSNLNNEKYNRLTDLSVVVSDSPTLILYAGKNAQDIGAGAGVGNVASSLTVSETVLKAVVDDSRNYFAYTVNGAIFVLSASDLSHIDSGTDLSIDLPEGTLGTDAVVVLGSLDHNLFIYDVNEKLPTESGSESVVVDLNASGDGGSSITIGFIATQVFDVAVSGDNMSCDAPSTVLENSSLTVTITADAGYVLSGVTVLMNGADITEAAYSGGVVSIGSVTGDVTISATTVAVPVPSPPIPVVNYSVIITGDNMTYEGPASVIAGSNLILTITADAGHVLSSVTVLMNGVDITETAYSDGAVSMDSVIGDVEITVISLVISIENNTNFADYILYIYSIVAIVLVLMILFLIILFKKKKDD